MVSFEFTKNSIPLVDDKYELLTCHISNTCEIDHQALIIIYGHICIFLMDVFLDNLLHLPHNRLFLDFRNKITDVQINHRIFVQMLLVVRIGGNQQIIEEMMRVARLVVVGTEHFRRHRLAETSRAGNTAEHSLRIDCAVDHRDKFRLVHVFTVAGYRECYVSYVDIVTHGDIWFLAL